MTLTYTPSTMEKLLGSWYKWWYLLSHSFKSRTTYQIDNTLFALGSVMTLVGTILTWYLASNATLGDKAFSEKLTYFVIGTIYINLVNTWPSFFGYTIKGGKHTADLLLPQRFFLLVWGRAFGTAIYQNLVVVSILTILSPLWLSFIEKPTSISQVLLLVLFLPITHISLFFLEFIVGLQAFFITEINGLILNYGFVNKLLAGQLFPLVLLIPSFFINLGNPFALTFYHPMQIYLGKYDTNQTILVFLGGVAWCLVLFFLAKLVFKLGLKRNESVGL